MYKPPLPLEIASGILMAVVIVWVFRAGVAAGMRREFYACFLYIGNAVLIGGGIILAGLGVVNW